VFALNYIQNLVSLLGETPSKWVKQVSL
jgi:hypothetical protein